MAATDLTRNIKALSRQLFGGQSDVLLRQLMSDLFILPRFFHEILLHRFYFDRTEKEIAHTLNVSEHLVRQRISVALTLLNILYASKPKNPV